MQAIYARVMKMHEGQRGLCSAKPSRRIDKLTTYGRSGFARSVGEAANHFFTAARRSCRWNRGGNIACNLTELGHQQAREMDRLMDSKHRPMPPPLEPRLRVGASIIDPVIRRVCMDVAMHAARRHQTVAVTAGTSRRSRAATGSQKWMRQRD